MEFHKTFLHPKAYVKICSWSLVLFIGGALLMLKRPDLARWGVVSALFGFGLSFLVWVVPLIVAKLERVWMKLLVSLLLAITGVVSSWMSLCEVAETTGFHPADYPSAVFALTVLLFVPALLLVILVLGLVLTYPAVPLYWILNLVGLAWKNLRNWADSLKEDGWARFAGWCGFLLSLGFVICFAGPTAKRYVDQSTKWIVYAFEYHESPKHPWTSYGHRLHFHENGLVTVATELGSDVSFEVDVPPPPRPRPEDKQRKEERCAECGCCTK